MAKKATKASPGKKVSVKQASSRAGGSARQEMGDAFIKLLQSPLVAELVAAAATAALASFASEGFGKSGSGGKRAGRAVKQAGMAAANAIGQRLTTEIDEIKKAAKAKKA
jgi:hypothetical protein